MEVRWGTWSPEKDGAVKTTRKGSEGAERRRMKLRCRGEHGRSTTACSSTLAMAAVSVARVKLVVAWQGADVVVRYCSRRTASREVLL
jgi:hypothetical protein